MDDAKQTQKPTFLETILEQMSRPQMILFAERAQPKPVAEGEKVIGVVPERLRPMLGWYLATKGFTVNMEDTHHSVKHDHSTENCKEYLLKLREQILGQNFAHDLLWISIREELGFWDPGVLGIRSDFQVVLYNEPVQATELTLLFTEDKELIKAFDRNYLCLS